MNLLKKVAMIACGFIVLFAIVGLMLPSTYEVKRQVSINASAPEVYANIVNLKAWREWSVWYERDPNMKVTFSGPDSNVGMKSSWLSETEGNGVMTLTQVNENQMVEYDLQFPDMGFGSVGVLTLQEENGGTLVVWTNTGEIGYNPIFRYFGLMMDGMIGPDFEAGLANLKEKLEN